ncbi:MAG: rod shape-determining protein [Ramlibacter sp.]|nr:rod shape-determining protein [Ramlibacter sp.]
MSFLSSFSPLLYVQVSPEHLSVRDVKAGVEISEPAQVAIAQGAKATIAGVGLQAASAAAAGGPVELVKPFAHPRSLVSDFTVAEQLLKAFIRRVRRNTFLQLPPRVVVHLLGNPAGGFTQVEVRAFTEMALGAGAFEVVIREGRPLTDQELLAGNFSAGGKVLS